MYFCQHTLSAWWSNHSPSDFIWHLTVLESRFAQGEALRLGARVLLHQLLREVQVPRGAGQAVEVRLGGRVRRHRRQRLPHQQIVIQPAVVNTLHGLALYNTGVVRESTVD